MLNKLSIVLDAPPSYVVPARVSFVAARAQLTPKQVETRTTRVVSRTSRNRPGNYEVVAEKPDGKLLARPDQINFRDLVGDVEDAADRVKVDGYANMNASLDGNKVDRNAFPDQPASESLHQTVIPGCDRSPLDLHIPSFFSR